MHFIFGKRYFWFIIDGIDLILRKTWFQFNNKNCIQIFATALKTKILSVVVLYNYRMTFLY